MSIVVKSLSPMQKDRLMQQYAHKLNPLEKLKYHQLNKSDKSGISNKSSSSPKRQHYQLINSSSETRHPILKPPRLKIETAMQALHNKIQSSSRSYHIIHDQQSPSVGNFSAHFNKSIFANKLTPNSNASRQIQTKHPFFIKRKLKKEENINLKLSTLKQGIDRCLKQFQIRRFQVLKKLGSGVNGDVVLARIRNLNFIVAMKEVKKTKAQQHSKCFVEQIKIQLFLDHPNIIKLYGVTSDQHSIFLILEVSSHNLFREIRQQKGFSQSKAKGYIRQVLSALQYMHSFGVIHRDVKPQNILNMYGVLKLCDFGWSAYKGQMGMRSTFCGTYDYVSPEVAKGQSYDQQVDAWSVGVLTFQMLTCSVPFKQKLLIKPQQIVFPSKLSRAAKNFISRLLHFEPSKRMTVQEAQQHSWLDLDPQDTSQTDRTLLAQDIELLNSQCGRY